VPRAGYIPLPGLNPITGREEEFFVSISHMEHMLSFGPAHRYFELKCVAEVMEKPRRIYQGLKRDGKKDALCYVGRPRRHGEDWEAPAPADMVFVVFITATHVIFEWRWEKADNVNESLPDNHAIRFEREIWKQSPTS
jgi:hypothetical protein